METMMSNKKVVSSSYTSLEDIIIMEQNNGSWYDDGDDDDDIPIKNPLLKHAALAYLKPMSTPPPVHNNKGFCYCVAAFFNTLFNPFVGCFTTRSNNKDWRRSASASPRQ
ncbi:hypothetical protein RIF29_23112 [Crotalaria pallida]|uniref:Uncharacterized protein n=1 Tax=Crotalaria pallida TaxID=3830 RepID=A0AAN9F9P6_CROPI